MTIRQLTVYNYPPFILSSILNSIGLLKWRRAVCCCYHYRIQTNKVTMWFNVRRYIWYNAGIGCRIWYRMRSTPLIVTGYTMINC